MISKDYNISIYISSNEDDCEVNCENIDEAIQELEQIKLENDL